MPRRIYNWNNIYAFFMENHIAGDLLPTKTQFRTFLSGLNGPYLPQRSSAGRNLVAAMFDAAKDCHPDKLNCVMWEEDDGLRFARWSITAQHQVEQEMLDAKTAIQQWTKRKASTRSGTAREDAAAPEFMTLRNRVVEQVVRDGRATRAELTAIADEYLQSIASADDERTADQLSEVASQGGKSSCTSNDEYLHSNDQKQHIPNQPSHVGSKARQPAFPTIEPYNHPAVETKAPVTPARTPRAGLFPISIREHACRQREAVCEEKERTLRQREAVCEETERTLQQRETVLAVRETHLHEKEKELDCTAAEFSKKAITSAEFDKKSFGDKKEELQSRRKELELKQAELARSVKRLQEKEVELCMMQQSVDRSAAQLGAARNRAQEWVRTIKGLFHAKAKEIGINLTWEDDLIADP